MYYVNREQIEQRLRYIGELLQSLNLLKSEWDATNILHVLAQERALHLAIECVTDIGSYMIDGFIMRDASSYEDIVDILADEEVFPRPVAASLIELVKLRKPLVQQFMELDSRELHHLVPGLPELLIVFVESVRTYLDRHLDA